MCLNVTKPFMFPIIIETDIASEMLLLMLWMKIAISFKISRTT